MLKMARYPTPTPDLFLLGPKFEGDNSWDAKPNDRIWYQNGYGTSMSLRVEGQELR